jgi:peptide/nickel transport system substrate-binding protein
MVVKLDQLVLKTTPDAATGANALSASDIGHMQYLRFDFLAPRRRNCEVRLMGLKGINMFHGNFRLNHASGPVADPMVRQGFVRAPDAATRKGVAERIWRAAYGLVLSVIWGNSRAQRTTARGGTT